MSKAYTGVSRQLVIAFDIGTTYSGVSYCLLDPGQEPKICNITRYPGQEHVSGSSKIPTILCYDSQGSLRAAGAEALLPENIEKFEDEEWVKAEWFKLRMHPASMQAADLPPLPPNKSLVQVFADFIGYLMACAKTFICETHLTLSNSWDTLKNNMTFVMGHPNGWEGAQQSLMRQAAIMANIIPDTTDGHSRVRFVTEGEASLHYCLREISLDDVKRGFVIADLGGGTLDFSAYKVAETKPMRVEEISAPKYKLQNSRYGSDEHVKQIGERFDETTKKIFRDTNDVCVVPFGSISDKDMENEIRSGKLKLSGDDVASFFKPAITASVTAIVDLINESSTPIKTVYLVGGFSASPYLTAQLVKHLSIFNISVTCPDGQTAKAVADGAISFYLDQFVSSRVSKASYGIEISYDYDSTDPEHNARMEDLSRQPSGRYVVSGGFATILKRARSNLPHTFSSLF
ncbi:hypothetical protein EW145_g4483 [Phellinidium pouzarii]|uniref:Uncharacterized protein n=1 Tax=Phellinidium pouzarii TaxID=167371 RepID=A0A4S4L3B1_9AGAM|nr:hypothetical protein EW145_g4483 [Phellinidium pouzarii]